MGREAGIDAGNSRLEAGTLLSQYSALRDQLHASIIQLPDQLLQQTPSFQLPLIKYIAEPRLRSIKKPPALRGPVDMKKGRPDGPARCAMGLVNHVKSAFSPQFLFC